MTRPAFDVACHDMKELPKNCFVCKKILKYNASNKTAKAQRLPLTPDTHDADAKSLMHYGHVTGTKRAMGEFGRLTSEDWAVLGIDDPAGAVAACYECHEVVLHNPVFNKEQLERLAQHFVNKGVADKVMILNKVFEAGLNNYEE